MKQQEKYWMYESSQPIPEFKDIANLGIFKGIEDEWNSLSPGMRKTIYNEFIRINKVKRGIICLNH